MTILVTPGAREAIRLVYEARVPLDIMPCVIDAAPSTTLPLIDRVLGYFNGIFRPCRGLLAIVPVPLRDAVQAFVYGEPDTQSLKATLYASDASLSRLAEIADVTADPNNLQDVTLYVIHGSPSVVFNTTYLVGLDTVSDVLIVNVASRSLEYRASMTNQSLYSAIPLYNRLAGLLEPVSGTAAVLDYQSSYDTTTSTATVSWDVVLPVGGSYKRLTGSSTFAASEAPGDPEAAILKDGRTYMLLGPSPTGSQAVILDLESGEAEVYILPSTPSAPAAAAEPGVGVCYPGTPPMRVGDVACPVNGSGIVTGVNSKFSIHITGAGGLAAGASVAAAYASWILDPTGGNIDATRPVAIVDPAAGRLYANMGNRLVIVEYR